MPNYMPAREVHTYFDNGNDEGHKIWEGLAATWGIFQGVLQMKSIKINARLMGGDYPRMEEVIVNMDYIVLFKPATGLLIMSGIATDNSMNAYEVDEADRNRLASAL